MFQNNFPNNFSDVDFNQMYYSSNPIIDNNNMEMNSLNNAQINNQMNQGIDNNNLAYNDKVDLDFGFNEHNFKEFSKTLNSLTDPKKKLYISNTEQKKEILVPIYFTKKELYAYLKFFGNIAIIYNNNILNNDQTSIDIFPTIVQLYYLIYQINLIIVLLHYLNIWKAYSRIKTRLILDVERQMVKFTISIFPQIFFYL